VDVAACYLGHLKIYWLIEKLLIDSRDRRKEWRNESINHAIKLTCLLRQVLCGQMPTYLADDIISSPKAIDDPFGLPLITCARCHVRTTVLETEALALWVRAANSLPRGLRTLDVSYKQFKTLLCLTRVRRFVTFYISPLEILLLT